MSMQVIVSGGRKQADFAILNLAKNTRHGIRQAFFAQGKDLVSMAQSLIIKGPKTGRLYRIPGRRRRHRASAPGQPPANLSGSLRKSIDFQIHGAQQLEFGSRPGKFGGTTANTANYAKVLEEGGGRIQKRPYLEPTVKKNQRNLQKHSRNRLRQALK